MSWMLGAFGIALIGCQHAEGSDTGDRATVAAPEFGITPPALDLGDAELDQQVRSQINLSNMGDSALFVLDLGDVEDDDLSLSLGGASTVQPGSSVPIEVVWTPTAVGSLDTSLTLSLGARKDDGQRVSVPVTGSALGPVATLSATDHDFGDVGLGCDDDFSFTLSNTGNLDLEVTAVSVRGDEGYQHAQSLDLPWVLSAMQSRGQGVSFSPVAGRTTSR